jgi:hypothetical protein
MSLHTTRSSVASLLTLVGVSVLTLATSSPALASSDVSRDSVRMDEGTTLHATANWGKATPLPGLAALNAYGSAEAQSISCFSSGNCAAGGYYTNSAGAEEAFVVNQTSGTWGKAEEVPGISTLNAGDAAEVDTVSCGAAGSCSAGGSYTDSSGNYQAWVVSETKGTWGKAEEVPATGALNTGGNAEVDSVSCRSASSCAAGGYYTDGSGNNQAFVVSETGGTWGDAEEAPGTQTTSGEAAIYSISCSSAGNCSAGGFYTDSSDNEQAFVINETAGSWENAEEVPGVAALSDYSQVNSISCVSVGNCAVGGWYSGYDGFSRDFVASETGGSWGNAEQVPGTKSPPYQLANSSVGTVSCTSSGNCVAGGFLTEKSGHETAFVTNEEVGVWQKAKTLAGTADQNGNFAPTPWVSCISTGNCSVVGNYTNSSNDYEVFAANEASGTWGATEEIPGAAALNSDGYASVNWVSCTSDGYCAAVGYYVGSNGQQAFVVER